jgi:quercetin dioxygenase-like cupin family protein
VSQSDPLQFPSFPKPAVHVVLWEGPGKPTEEGIRGRLVEEGYGVVKWTNEPATGYQPHAHIYPETMWIISGSLTVILPADGRLIELLPGDRIEIPQGILHGGMAGAEGTTYLLATR